MPHCKLFGCMKYVSVPRWGIDEGHGQVCELLLEHKEHNYVNPQRFSKLRFVLDETRS